MIAIEEKKKEIDDKIEAYKAEVGDEPDEEAKAILMVMEGQVFLFEFQAEDKEFEEMEAVFLAISTSVLGYAPSSASEKS